MDSVVDVVGMELGAVTRMLEVDKEAAEVPFTAESDDSFLLEALVEEDDGVEAVERLSC